MAHFHPLTVTAIENTTRDAVVVTFESADDSDFSFTAGQYLTFKRDFDGTEIRRSYSICAGEDDGTLQVGIKQVDGGAFSAWANEALEVGETLMAMPPMGKFNADTIGNHDRHYLGFAGGSGITPVLSIIRTVLAREPHSRFTLVYANRAVSTIMFRQELEDLKNLHMDRLHIVHVLEQNADEVDLLTGRLDAQKCQAMFENIIHLDTVDRAFICGPEPMMLTIKQALLDGGMAKDAIRFELFASAQTGRLEKRRNTQAAALATDGVQATVSLGGESRDFTMDQKATLLEAALENAVEAPHACQAGVCSTCKCKIVEGEVEMVTNHALEDYEVAQGYVLSCQSFPVTKRVSFIYEDH